MSGTTKYIDHSHVTVTTKDAKYKFGGYMRLLKNVSDKSIKFQRKVFRCELPADTNVIRNCGQIGNMAEGNLCTVFKGKESLPFAQRFFSGFVPRLRCPLKAGIYNMSKVVAEFNEFLRFPIEGAPWRLVHKVIMGNKTIACADWVLKIQSQ